MTDLTPKELYDLERQKRLNQDQRSAQWKTGRKVSKWVLIGTLVLVVLGIGGWYISRNAPDTSDPLTMCIQHQNLTMHTHPHIAITIKRQAQEIPANIGLSATCMRPVHTHDATGTIHIEFPFQYDAKLGDFFKIWEKQFSSTCVLDKCNGTEGTVTMTVNGQSNIEFENYIMKDLDRIEIKFE